MQVRAGFGQTTGNAPTKPTSSSTSSELGESVQAFKQGAAEEAQRVSPAAPSSLSGADR